jgi:starvation-inducible outer membrane lipoprotein|tara:strand:+ start:1438 stop:1692 length:255 start_codon:yes stop_codon:yes gene_type:complete
MRSANQKTRDVIMAVYRSQLKKLKSLAVYDDDGNFLYGQETEFGTKVTEHLIKITEKRLLELVNQNLNRRGIPPIENHTNGKAK